MTSIEEAIKSRSFKNNKHKAVVNIFYTSNILTNQLGEIFDQFDISRQQYNVLRILRGAYPNSSNCGSLKDVMLERNPDITRLCNRLIDKGLIVRKTNPVNKRSMQLTINVKGLNLLEKMDPYVEKHYNALNITMDEAEQLSFLLDKLRG